MVSSSFRGAPRVKLLCALVASCFAAEGLANPTGPAVAAGAASFNTIGKALTVTNTPNAIINWQGFSIGAGEITRFQQQGASSAVLNRVVGQDPSAILGTLSSNGKVFLVNPNGVLFGQGSRVDVAGLVASTLNITDRDFLAGRLNFQAGTVSGSIVNQGEIVSASGGRIYLIAPDVQNHGLISSPSGEVVLAAGKTVSLVDSDVPNLKVEVQAGGEALNVGRILAEGGKAGIYAGLINQRGIVRADSVSKDATGKIVFKASDTTILDDGSVTSATGAKGGEIQVLGNKVGLVGTARVDASGDAGGGTVLIGGDFQGNNSDIQNSYRTFFGPQSSIRADAITSGDGGKVIVWSDDATRAYGTISARGGAQGGNGGLVEVSGKNWLDFQAMVDTSAPQGAAGVLLLDPTHVDIVSGSGVTGGGAFDGGTTDNIFGNTGSTPSSIGWDTIKANLTTTPSGGTNVFINTSGFQCSASGACGAIDILAASPDLAASKTLRLIAYHNVNVNSSILNSGSGAVELYAGWNGSGPGGPTYTLTNVGQITIGAPINVAGNLLLRANSGITDSGISTAAITAPALLANTNTGSVLLNSSTHMVDALAGASTDQFRFKNGKTLSIGTVGGVNGITVVAPSGFSDATINVQVTSGDLNVTQPVSAIASDPGGAAAVTLQTSSGSIVTSGSGNVSALGGDDFSGAGGAATVSLISNNAVTLNGTSVTATGGSDTSGGAGSADVLVQAGGLISVSGSSTISAIGGNGAGGGGNASVSLQTTNPGAAISIADSEVSALFISSGNALSTVTMNAAGALSISGNSTIEAYSGQVAAVNFTAGGDLSIGAGLSPVLEARGTTNTSVFLSSTSGNVEIGGNVLSDGGIGVTSLNINAPAGAITSVGGGILQSPSTAAEFGLGAQKGIGTVANPIRIENNNIDVAAFNTGTTGDIAISFVNGDVTLVPGDLMNVLNSNPTGTYMVRAESGNILLSMAFKPGASSADLVAGQSVILQAPAGSVTLDSAGSILATGTGNVTLEGNHLFLTGVGTQISGNNVSLFANDMDLSLGGAIVATTSATLAPFDLTTNMAISANPLPCGMLCLSPAEIQKVSAPVLTLGRSDSTTNILYLQDPLTSGNYAVAPGTGLLRLRAGFIYENGGGGIGGPFNHSLELRAGGNINLTVNSIIIGDNNNLSVLAGQDFAGDLNIGGVTLKVGTTAANTGSMTIQAGNSGLGTQGNINAIVSGGGGGAILVTGTGTQSISATNDIVLHNNNVSTGVLSVGTAAGAQTISAGNSLFVFGGDGTNTVAAISTSSGAQTVAAGNILVRGGSSGTGNVARIASGGNQTVTAGAISVEGGSGGGGFGIGNMALISADASQTVNVGSGGLALIAGGGEDNAAVITQQGLSGSTQVINVAGGGAIVIQGGSSAATPTTSPHGARAQILASGDSQTINFAAGGSIDLTGGTVGSRNYALILSENAQTISGGPSITMTGGASGGLAGGHGNFARISSNNGSQSITASALTLTGGAGGIENFANLGSNLNQVANTSTQAITMTGGGTVTLQGGAGTTNFARIRNFGLSQTIDFTSGGSLVLAGGGSGTDNYAQVWASTGSQTISGSPTITLTGGAGGGGSGTGNFAQIRSDDSQSITVGSGGLQLTGGGGALTDNFASVFQAGLSGTTQTITVNGGGAIGVHGGSTAQSSVQPSAPPPSHGSFAFLRGDGDSQTISFTSGGAISITGGTNGSSNNAGIRAANGTQTISGSPNIALIGGANGGVDNEGNSAIIQANVGAQTIIAGNMSLTAGATGINNFAAITSPTQDITVHGALGLTGGGSAAGTVTGGGARIGGNGGSSPGPTNLTLNVDGNVSMTGGSAANAGAAIGSGFLGGQATSITMSAGGNVTLNPGTVANGGSRIGSPTSAIAGGNIAVTAGGTLALNSTGPGLGTAIRTLGNVTLNAASITQGADSEIISGGTTTIMGGTVSLPSATNQFGTVLLATTGNVTITDADAINFGTSTTGSGSLTVTAPGGITQSGPITTGAATFHAGASPITLTNSGNDFTGLVDLDTSSSAQITDANSFIIKGGGGAGPNPTSLTINANGAVTQSAAFTGSAPAAIVINAGSGPITLNNASNNFTGNTSVVANTSGAASLVNNNVGGINLGASTVGGALALTSGGPVTQSGAITVAGASTINAGSNAITLTNGSNDFVGALNFTGSNVSITDVNAIAIGNSNASGTLNIVATSTSFLNGFSANNYSFSGGTYALAAGTYNLGGTTTVAQNPVTGAPTTVDVQSGATINTSGGTVNVGAGGTLSGTGTIQGNVNNVAGTVSPGASPGMLTITGNYTQGASGVLDMQIGGLVAGTDYDQLRVGGTTSLAGTLNTALINGFVPVSGQTFTLIQSTGAISGTFTTTNQPVGTLFNSFYGPTTFDFVAASGGGSVPPQLVPVVQNTIVSVEQVLVALAPTTTTTNSETGLLLVTGIDVAPATEARDESKAVAGSDKKEEKSVAKKTFCN